MKILLLNKYHYKKGGAERAYFDMATILQAAGHEVAFFSMLHAQNEVTPWSKYFVSETDYHDLRYSLFQKIKAGLKIIWNHEANKKLAALIDDFQPDIAHAHNIYHQLSPSIFHVLKRKKVPLVLTLHDYKLISPNYNLYANGALWDFASGFRCIKDRCIQGSTIKSVICALEKWVHSFLQSYQKVDLLIAPSSFLASKVEKLGWQSKKIYVLPNPLRKEELQPHQDLPPREKDRLVFFGRLSEEKGIEQILEALSEVPQKRLIIIGDGPQKEYLQKRTKDLLIESRVQFIGPLYSKALQRELQKAEAVIIPSVWYENLPYVVTESLALGLVVIASESGGIPERITHGLNGFLYPMNDISALVTTLKEVNHHDLESIRRNAQASVSDLAPEIFLSKLEFLYQKAR